MPDSAASFHLAVLNPGGKDPPQSFPDGAPPPGSHGHPPVNFHAYAACTRGWFCRTVKQVLKEGPSACLVLLRSDLRQALKAVLQLKSAGVPVFVSFKETGSFQVARQLSDPAVLDRAREAIRRAHGAIAATPWLVPFYKNLAGRLNYPAEFIPTPYPVDQPAWDFAIPFAERRGIFLGTREPATPSRQHLAALLALRSILGARKNLPLTLFNLEGRQGQRWLENTGLDLERPGVQILTRRLAYPDYLKVLATHRIVFQLDQSHVPGQVAGDCLLTRVPCVGGNGAIERVAFPNVSGDLNEAETMCAWAAELLRDDDLYMQFISQAEERALRELCFPVVAKRLKDFYRSLQQP